jgi:bacteriocin biosynthesis cyclodehydratase domain-containing protein
MAQNKIYLPRPNGHIHAVHILSVGAFGQAVAGALKRLVAGVYETRVDGGHLTYPALWPTAQVHLLATWRPMPRLSRACDEMSHAWRAPFIEAVLETPNLRVGPVVVPGVGACHACAERRALQHSPRPIEHIALREFYDANPQQGPQGFLPGFPEIAAVRLAQFMRQIRSEPAAVAGRVWRMNTIHRETVSSMVVGVHECPRCGLKRDESTRSFAALHREVTDLLTLNAKGNWLEVDGEVRRVAAD